MVNRPPASFFYERPPRRDAINLISGLGGWFCGGAAVVGGFGTECGRFAVVALSYLPCI